MSATTATTTRSLALWVPDWPVLAAMKAADIPAHQPTAVCENNRIIAVSAPARGAGVRRGMRKRQAHGLCPELELLTRDDGRDARMFEPVAVAAESVVAGLEISRAGLLLLPAAGASRFYGSEEKLIEKLVTTVTEHTGYECQVGVADGILAAVLAARANTVVPPGGSVDYLAARPLIDVVHVAMTPERSAEISNLVDLWGRLGIRNMADLAYLPLTDIEARFGAAGAWVHHLARGQDLRPHAQRRIEADVEAESVLDPPAQRIDIAAFAARRLAEDLHTMLVERTASCSRLQISAKTESGRELARTWRTDDGALGGLTVNRITDRVRWQLEGWISGSADRSTDSAVQEHGDGLVWLGLAAQGLVEAGAHQGRLWGGDSGAQLRAHRALERVQGLLGVDAVLQAHLQGGRELRDQVHLTPWGDMSELERLRSAPWPGKLPQPAPANVLTEPQVAQVLNHENYPITVDRRMRISATPSVLTYGNRTVQISAWAGPWPVAQRWWRSDALRAVYLQAVLKDGAAVLLSCAQGRWLLEAHYD